MQKLYVVPKNVWLEHVELFSPASGSHYINLVATPADVTDTNFILVAAAFVNENALDVFEEHPEVAAMPHPTTEGNVKLKGKLKQQHLDALGKCKRLGLDDSDTCLSLSQKASRLHPLVRFRGVS